MSPPPKVPNAERRSREHLTAVEIDRLIAAAHRLGRHGHRDATMILLAYRHGLRVSELVSLRREQLDLRQGLLHVRRRKNGLPSTHPLRGPELRSLREVLRDYPESPYVFISERLAPMTAATFRKLLARAGDAANLGMPIHPHMLRHSTGFKLANDGQDTPVPSSTISGTGTSSTPCSTPSSPPIASTTSGKTDWGLSPADHSHPWIKIFEGLSAEPLYREPDCQLVRAQPALSSHA